MDLNWMLPKPGEAQNIRIIIAKSRGNAGSVPMTLEFNPKKWPWCGPTLLGVALKRRRRRAFWYLGSGGR